MASGFPVKEPGPSTPPHVNSLGSTHKGFNCRVCRKTQREPSKCISVSWLRQLLTAHNDEAPKLGPDDTPMSGATYGRREYVRHQLR